MPRLLQHLSPLFEPSGSTFFPPRTPSIDITVSNREQCRIVLDLSGYNRVHGQTARFE
jgi:hypothetical protein